MLPLSPDGGAVFRVCSSKMLTVVLPPHILGLKTCKKDNDILNGDVWGRGCAPTYEKSQKVAVAARSVIAHQNATEKMNK